MILALDPFYELMLLKGVAQLSYCLFAPSRVLPRVVESMSVSLSRELRRVWNINRD